MKGDEVYHVSSDNENCTDIRSIRDEIGKDHALADLTRRSEGKLDRSAHTPIQRCFDTGRALEEFRMVD